ncbi:MAG: 23S rRNA (pseudouridine(1915)-N(3))-methyltransferase RlmH [Sphingomonadales bacterium]|nr:23S rRNA (pseudouridine(1915)-N(3))-methyltransferase RlmH [Sphingomonadales bacterium]
MRIKILAVGRAAGTPEAALVSEYLKRLPWQADIREIEVKGRLKAAERGRRENDLLIKAIPSDARLVVLDEGGNRLTSAEFAKTIDRWRQQAINTLAFMIGGADGLNETVKMRADAVISLSDMTLPHLMARAVLAEQIYRAYTILENHPYHRA